MSKNFSWTTEAWSDYIYWQNQDKKTLKRINRLIANIMSTPFEGIGKPEALKDNLSGFWSRRINNFDRLVYVYEKDHLTVISCRYHYQ